MNNLSKKTSARAEAELSPNSGKKIRSSKVSQVFSGKSLTIARHEFLKTIRRKEFLFMTFIFPLFFVLIVIGPALLSGISSSESHNIAYVDLSGRLDFSEVEDKISRQGILFIGYESVEEAKIALDAGEVSSYLVVPENFIESGFVELYSVNKGEAFSGPELSAQLSYVIVTSLLKDKVEAPILKRVRTPVKIKSFSLGEEGDAKERGFADILGEFGLPFISSILLLFSIFSASG
ncbi:MAG: ABC transporter permease, partial [Methanosarcinaceae archaeon]|nr:ABC transporter permease [Methanosarcinaceae archaeon]